MVDTANEVWQLPCELLRKGRLDEIFYVDLPLEEERAEIFRIHLAKRNRNPDEFDLEALVAENELFAAELAAVNLKPQRFHGEWNYVIYPRESR